MMPRTNDTRRRIYRLLATFLFALPALAAPPEQVTGTDRVPAQLLVSVRFGSDIAAAHGAADGSVGYSSEKSGGREQPSHQVRVYQTQSRARVQQVRVLEGHTAYVGHNESEPYPAAFSGDGHGRGLPFYALEYRTLERGFAVRPRYDGDQLLLDISAGSDRRSRQGGGIIDSTVVQTTVPVELDRWIRLAGADEPPADRPGTYRTPLPETRDGQDEVWVRVERLD